jgi:hypothetical protein
MAKHARYGDMTVNPDHTPRKITKNHMIKRKSLFFNPFTASCENAMALSEPGISASYEKFPHSSQLNI